MEDRTLAGVIHWADKNDSVRAVILTSSRANPSATVDSFSDYDILLAVADILPFYEDRRWLGSFGEVLITYRDPICEHLGFSRFIYVTQFEDSVKIDFTLWPVDLLQKVARGSELPDELDVGYAVLLDKDGIAKGMKPPSFKAHVPSPPDAAEFQNLIEEFFHESTYAAKHLGRGDLLPLKYNLDHAMKQVNLRKMLEWRIELDHGWSVKPGSYGRGLRELLTPETWRELQQTYTGPEPEANWEVLFGTIALFRRIGKEVGAVLGFSYPSDLDERVMRYLRKVKAAGR